MRAIFRKILFFLILAGVSVLLLSCGGNDPSVPPSNDNSIRMMGVTLPPGTKSLIVYTRKLTDIQSPYGFNNELYLMTAYGGVQKRITYNHADDDYPAFGPYCGGVAFVSNRSTGNGGCHDIFRMDLTGYVTQLTDEGWEFDSSATDWAPGQITASQLNVLIEGPFDVVRLVSLDPYGAWENTIDTGQIANYDAAQGRKPNLLVFSARPNGPGYFGDMELFLMVDWLEAPYQITNMGSENPDPADFIITRNASFDRTGTKIIFQTNYWDGNWEIGYIDLNSADVFPVPHRLTNSASDDIAPCFDPTGTWYAWATNRDGNYEIYKQMVYDSSLPGPVPPIYRLTYTPEDESNPDWGPMG
jgi:hypothetical protein